MAGHSKWANTKHRKAAQDAKKGQAYAQSARELTIAAKLGGDDPSGNFRLRTAIDRAKAAGLPNDNIQRAIDKGAGNLEADNMEELNYEGYGPSGVAVFIETMTENKNRTAGDIRSYFNKFSGNLGTDGSVAWIFEERGLIQVEQSALPEEEAFDKAIEAGAADFEVNADEAVYDIYTEPSELNTVAKALSEAEMPVKSAEMTRVPKNTSAVTDEEKAKDLMKLLSALEEHDDVQAVYANFEMDDALLEKVTS